MRPRAEIQHVHQRRGVTDLARNLERLLGVCERDLGIAEQPKGQRFPAQGCRADVLAKTCRKSTMLGGIVELDRATEMRSPSTMSPVCTKDKPMRRCAIMSGRVAFFLFARARNWTASSRITSPLNATRFATQKP